MAEPGAFDHYEVLKHDDGTLFELGRGAMGITYKAFDENLRVPVALKVINSATLQGDLAKQRFVREARAAAQVRHPNIASVFHLGMKGDRYFYAMEFIEGETVEERIRRTGALAPLLALRVTAQVAKALGAVEKQGLVHRDIKPSNIMLENGRDDLAVKVIDFGLAKSCKNSGAEDLATLSTAGFIGTPQFSSPEQIEEQEIDIRSDIYSLGVTLWYMLSSKAPFTGSRTYVSIQHLSKPLPFHELRKLPKAVVPLLKRMLEKSADDRFQTSAELRGEIDRTIGVLERGVVTALNAPVYSEEFPTIDARTRERPYYSPNLPPVSGKGKTHTGPSLQATATPDTPALAGSRRKIPIRLILGVTSVVILSGAVFFMRKKPESSSGNGNSGSEISHSFAGNSNPQVSIPPMREQVTTPAPAPSLPSATPSAPETIAKASVPATPMPIVVSPTPSPVPLPLVAAAPSVAFANQASIQLRRPSPTPIALVSGSFQPGEYVGREGSFSVSGPGAAEDQRTRWIGTSKAFSAMWVTGPAKGNPDLPNVPSDAVFPAGWCFGTESTNGQIIAAQQVGDELTIAILRQTKDQWDTPIYSLDGAQQWIFRKEPDDIQQP